MIGNLTDEAVQVISRDVSRMLACTSFPFERIILREMFLPFFFRNTTMFENECIQSSLILIRFK